MRKDFGYNTWLYPMPVLIIGTYDEDGNPNAMNAAWGGVCDFDKISIALSDHVTTKNILFSKEFTVSLGTKDTVVSCDYVGLVSQKVEHDKVLKSGFTAIPSNKVKAPSFKELPLTLECSLVSYENEVLIGKIINVTCDEDYLAKDGLPDIDKMNPIIFETIHHGYYEAGKRIAEAFSVGKEIK